MYRNRTHAGTVLAEHVLAKLSPQWANPLVVAIPRGGVVVAREVARALNAQMDLVMAKKIGAPWNPEFAVAAVDPDGEIVKSPLVSDTMLPPGYVQRQAEVRKQEISATLERLRGIAPARDPEGKTAILVDDGLATGLTAIAAVRYLRRKKARRIVVAVPVAPEDTLASLEHLADAVVCPLIPPVFHAVGEWYEDFEQVSDDEVRAILEEFKDAQ